MMFALSCKFSVAAYGGNLLGYICHTLMTYRLGCSHCIAEAGNPTDFAIDLTMNIAVEQHPMGIPWQSARLISAL